MQNDAVSTRTPAIAPDLYGPVHKGLRRALFHVAERLGAVDVSSPSELAKTLAVTSEVLALCRWHAEREERFVHALLRRHGCEPTRATGEHEALLGHIEGLNELVRALEEAAREAPVAAAEPWRRRLELDFQHFVTIELAHQAEEEALLGELLRARVPGEELARTQRAILRSFEPSELRTFLRWIGPALGRVERNRLAQGLASMLEPEARSAAIASLETGEPLEGTALLQIDFDFLGPFGDDLAREFAPLAERIAETDGLVWKIWTENPRARRAGGIYLFTSEEALEHFLEEHRRRLEGFGVTDVRIQVFSVNAQLGAIDRAPLRATLVAH